jgi:NAD-dependent protein deacetylase/lipoamidase
MSMGPAAEAVSQAVDILDAASSLVVLTGAGVSAESGVPTFRASDGLWYEHRVEDVATPRAFHRDPELVWDFYNARRQNLAEVEPNAGHHALAELERRFQRFTLVTQNIDGLHRLAGSRNVLEVHGNLWQVRCTGCETVLDKTRVELDPLPHCEDCGRMLRPNVVWFEEELPADVWQAASEAVDACACLMVVGTSAVVYPVAGLVWHAKHCGAKVIEVNLEVTDATAVADVSVLGPSGQTLPLIVQRLSEN